MPNSQQYSRNTVKSLRASITNKNQGGGNKKSGLISSTGGRPGLSLFRAGSTQAQRESRFCINQIGGVGSGVHQTQAPADGVNKSVCEWSNIKKTEQPKNIGFIGQNVNAFKAPFEQFQNTGNKCNSGYKYIPNSDEIDGFVEQVHSEKKRLLFAQWIRDANSKIVNNVAAFLTKTQVVNGMKQLVETLTSHGAANTLSAWTTNAANAAERTTSTPLNGHEYQPDDRLGNEKYPGLEPTLPLLNPLTNTKLSQIAGQIYSLTSNKVIYGNSYVDEVVNFNQEWNKNQYDLTFNAKDKVYVDKAEGSLPNISSGLLISKIGSLYGLYYELITQLQTKLQEGAITLETATPTTSENANGAVLKSANQSLQLDSSQSEDPGYFKLNDITIENLNPLKVFKAERVKDGDDVKFNPATKSMDSYVPGVSSAYKGINDVFDSTSSLALLNSNSPFYQSVNPLYQNTEAGTILKKAIEDTILSNQQLKDSASVILSSNVSPSYSVGTTYNAGGAVIRLSGLNDIQGNTNDLLVTIQEQQHTHKSMLQNYQATIDLNYQDLVELKRKRTVAHASYDQTKPNPTLGEWIKPADGSIFSQFLVFKEAVPDFYEFNSAALDGIKDKTQLPYQHVPGGFINKYSEEIQYEKFRTTLLTELNTVTGTSWVTFFTATPQLTSLTGKIINNYYLLKVTLGFTDDQILSMNDQYTSIGRIGLISASLKAASDDESNAQFFRYLEINMIELHNQYLTLISNFNTNQQFIVEKGVNEVEFKTKALSLTKTLGAGHLIPEGAPTFDEIKILISKITDPTRVDSKGMVVVDEIGNGVGPILSTNVQTASEHGVNSPNKSSFGLSLELLLGSILVTQAYGGKIMTLMLKISNENGVAIGSVWADAFNYTVGWTAAGTQDGLDHYIEASSTDGKRNEWAKSKSKDIQDLKALLDISDAHDDVNKEFKYYKKNGLHAFNQRPDLQDVDQPINGHKNAKFYTNGGAFATTSTTTTTNKIGPKYLENGEIIYGGVDGELLKLVSVNYAGTATESRYITGWVTADKADNGQGVNEMIDRVTGSQTHLTLDDWQGAIRLGNVTGDTGTPSGTQANIFGYNVQIPAEAINISNKPNVLTMPEDLTLDFLDPIVVKLLKGDSLTKNEGNKLMDKISIAKIIKTFMEFQYHEPTYIHLFDGGSDKVADTEENRGTEDYVFGSWANPTDSTYNGVPQQPKVNAEESSTQTNRVFLGYNGVSIKAALDADQVHITFENCVVLGINGGQVVAGVALGNTTSMDVFKNKSGVYLYPSRPQVDVEKYRGSAAAGSPWAQAADGTNSRIVALIQSQIQDWLGIGTIVPKDFGFGVGPSCQFALYPYKFITSRVKEDNFSPFSIANFAKATTTALDKLLFDTMKSDVLTLANKYISKQTIHMTEFIERVEQDLSGINHEQFTNNEVSMGGNTFALFDYRPFNFKSKTFDSSFAMCKIVSMTLKIFYQERILALSSRIKVFTDIIHSFNTSVNSLSVNTNEKLRYKIMIGFYFKFITQIKDQISMLKTLLKNDNYFSPVEHSQDTATNGVANLNNHPSSYSISESDLIISFKNSPPIGFESASLKIITKSIESPASFIADENLDGGTKKNILGVNWLSESTITPKTTAFATAALGTVTPVKVGKIRISNSNMPTLSEAHKRSLNNEINGVSALETAGFKGDELEVSIQNVDLSLVGKSNSDTQVIEVLNLKGQATMKKLDGTDVDTADDVVAAVANLNSILKSYGHSAVTNYDDTDDSSDSANAIIKPSLSYPAINNLESGLNVQYTPKEISSSITLDPRYPPVSSVSFSELENPLENISSLELFAEIGPNGNLVSSDAEINYTQINDTLSTTLNDALTASSGKDNLGSLDNYLSYFQQFLYVKKADVSDFTSFGSLIQKLYSYGEIDGINNQLGVPIFNRPNFTDLVDSEGPNNFLQEVKNSALDRIKKLVAKENSFPQTDFSSLLPFYHELITYANDLNIQGVSNLGAYVNIQCPQNGIKNDATFKTRSNSILPRYKDDAPVKGPFQMDDEVVNQNLGVGYINNNPLNDADPKFTESITTIKVSPSLPSNSLTSSA